MKLTYLGTAAAEGWPALFCSCPSCRSARELGGKNIRTRSQSVVNDDLLLDFPADTYLHVLHYGLDLDKITNILITHPHEDHLYMEELANRQEGYIPKGCRPDFLLRLYGSESVVPEYQRVCQNHYNQSLPTVVAMEMLTPYQPVEIGHYTVHPMLADHDKTMTCLIYAITDHTDGKTLLYAHDTGYLRDDVWEYIKQAGLRFDLVSLDCNHGKEASSRNHMGLACAGEVKERLLAEGFATDQTVFVVNHFSHNCRFLSHNEIEQAAKEYGFLVSYDQLQLTV